MPLSKRLSSVLEGSEPYAPATFEVKKRFAAAMLREARWIWSRLQRSLLAEDLE
jgi:hypothetical protein